MLDDAAFGNPASSHAKVNVITQVRMSMGTIRATTKQCACTMR